MEKITYRLTLDVQKHGIQRILQGITCNDKMSRRIEISLASGSEAYELPLDNVLASMYVRQPSSEEPSINACTIENNTIIYDVLPGDISEEGTVELQLKVVGTSMHGATSVLVSPKFAIDVWASNTDDSSAETSPTFTSLEDALAKAIEVYNHQIKRIEVDKESLLFIVEYADGSTYETDALKGLALSVEVGSVIDGDTASVRNSGTPQNAILDFVIPKGQKGDKGDTGSQGLRGLTGDKGDKGESATIQIGTVEAGAEARVDNVGTLTDAVFNFVLPKGDKGDKGDRGDDGTSFTIKGVYPSYEDMIAAHPTGTVGDAYDVGTEESNVVYLWDGDANMWVSIGAIKGAKGDKGDQGEQGIPGVSPTIIDNLDSASTVNALSANQGRVLANKITGLGTVFTYKGTVHSEEDLPTPSEEKNGWVYRVHTLGEDYVCEYDSEDGAWVWTEMGGGHVDLSGYYTKVETDAKVEESLIPLNEDIANLTEDVSDLSDDVESLKVVELNSYEEWLAIPDRLTNGIRYRIKNMNPMDAYNMPYKDTTVGDALESTIPKLLWENPIKTSQNFNAQTIAVDLTDCKVIRISFLIGGNEFSQNFYIDNVGGHLASCSMATNTSGYYSNVYSRQFNTKSNGIEFASGYSSNGGSGQVNANACVPIMIWKVA